jgi:hypothetical protein
MRGKRMLILFAFLSPQILTISQLIHMEECHIYCQTNHEIAVHKYMTHRKNEVQLSVKKKQKVNYNNNTHRDSQGSSKTSNK